MLLAIGAVAPIFHGDYVRGLGANWALTIFVIFTSVTTVAGGLVSLFNGPRRVQV